MSIHRAVIEAGPGALRQLCCNTCAVVDAEIVDAALGVIDDPVALVAEQPMAVVSLWSDALSALCRDHHEGAIIVHPSWWSPTRVDTVTRAARTLTGEVSARPRSWLLARAQPGVGPEALAMVELTDGFAVVSGYSKTAAVRRRGDARVVAEEVARVVAKMTGATAVVVDAAHGVADARELATLIAAAIRETAGRTAMEVGDARLRRLAREIPPTPRASHVETPRSRARVKARLAGAGVALVVAGLAVLSGLAQTPERHQTAPSAVQLPATYLVEGRVALTVPSDWPTQRVAGGPGSDRILVTSPLDPETALHITQSPVPGETLADAGARLQRAIETEPAGVFVDFNPSGSSAGRPAVTYREVRPDHDVWWTVLLDGELRIGVGCQSRRGSQDAVREVCEQAVRSAHAVE
ncbi:type VII secretion-associated protein [Mycobacterium intermedium]|uniref:Type VII secretion-associated protein n=1 Tax=Mycobacterium intermedium TaxID=28445 RepID=A0A1E3SLJ8_MYCIE|nr:type VII secretion-associated protein [Mycobacterium intermedium]MCV6963500.1 type VII secretion-associated protein [Mycobacterium intermedium]ODR02979.1 type VII secretion-associated protein [Mycobacterium intermedium]OPE47115.1 type VII secretion-associated protein [Mycobacterium intermedium]ORB09628.1 type VII secretion-associated protein [Mycobacterium intermedium]